MKLSDLETVGKLAFLHRTLVDQANAIARDTVTITIGGTRAGQDIVNVALPCIAFTLPRLIAEVELELRRLGVTLN